MRFYSQVGQDRYLFDHYFAGRCGLTFVDVGAYDGETFSNSLFFEETLGWRGLCIEPLPDPFAKLQQRRTSRCIRGAVADFEGEARFLEVDAGADQMMLSGLADYYEEPHRQRVQRQATGVREISVPVYLFHKLVDDAGFDSIDYCSIDTEGSELPILKSIDFDKIKIGVLSVENNYQNPAIHALLEGRGYHRETLFHGYDELYVHRDLLKNRRSSALSTVSVIIPSRFDAAPGLNRGLWIERAIESIRSQQSDSPIQYEIVVGIDHSATIPPTIHSGKEPLRYARAAAEKRPCQAAAVNSAVAAARGTVIAMLEDDDQWNSTRLATGLMALQNFDFVSSTQLEVDEDGNVLQVNDYATPSGWMFHRHVWNQVGPFNEAFMFHIDNEWLARLNASKFTRCHQVEAGFPLESEYIRINRPRLRELVMSVPEGSALVQHQSREPLVRRTINTNSRTSMIRTDSKSWAESEQERNRLFATYGLKVF